MRKAMLVLVIVALALALGALLIAFANHHAALASSERAADARARDTALAIGHRLLRQGVTDREALAALLDETLDDTVAFVSLDVPRLGTIASAGDAPPLDEAFAERAVRAAAEDPFYLYRRPGPPPGGGVVEYAGVIGPRLMAMVHGRCRDCGHERGMMLRAWRGILGEEFSAGAPGAPLPRPLLRLGLRTEHLYASAHAARLLLLLSLIVAPLLGVAAVMAALVGRRAGKLETQAARAAHLASLGELAATVAHEIRNPVAAIKGYAQLMEEGVGEDAGRRAARTIREETERLQRTVDAVLGYARNAPPERRPVDLREVADEAAQRVASAVEERGVTLVRGYGDESVRAEVDRDQIVRAIENLLRNALVASPDGGRITLSLRPGRRAVEIGVADEGPGVAPADRERIFEPFQSGHAGGIGLGLAVVRRIAEAHGGSVSLASDRAAGTEVLVRLPAQ